MGIKIVVKCSGKCMIMPKMKIVEFAKGVEPDEVVMMSGFIRIYTVCLKSLHFQYNIT